jgi:hypothetical protein
MAITFYTGFEHGAFTDVVGTGGTAGVQSLVVNSGAYAARIQATGFGTSYFAVQHISSGVFPGGGFTGAVHYRFYFRYATGPASFGEPICGASGGNPNHAVWLRPDGTLAVYSNNSLQAAGTAVLSSNTWYRIDVSGAADASSAWTVKVNGVTDITTSSFFSQMSDLRIGRSIAWGNQTNNLDFFYDDFVLGNTSLPAADTRVANYTPTSNGASQQWTTGTGTTFAEVDDYTDDDTTYWGTGSNGLLHFSKMTPDILTGTVHSVCEMARVRSTVGGNIASITVRNNGSESNLLLGYPTTYTNYQHIVNTDPDGNSAWTIADMSTLECGVKTNSLNGGGQVRATSIVTKVLYDGTVQGPGAHSSILGGFAPFFR